MKTLKLLALFVVMAVGLSSCGVPQYATISKIPDFSKYKYVYITPTQELTSIAGGAVGTQYGVYSATTGKSVIPSNVIAGYFMKRGFVVVQEIDESQRAQTIVANYGESGRKNYALGYSIEITVQLLDASTNDVISVATAEGFGETEADDIRIATLKCLDGFFK